ncbi:hypothetical protein V2S66_31255 [Streptomyces sp. V4-01]|uniref:Uncharacterized protein n=1 Tax=Actinacidiphila polyblastidii TaxID=3110430 RepID=A0ABU7PKS7_9ACTN|nr:hypothetical protein [Streptomyces sp. V4-01]
MTADLWSIRDVAAHLGVAVGSARGQLSRWKVKAVAYEVGPSGRPEGRFDPVAVQEAAANRAGRGRRTDLR